MPGRADKNSHGREERKARARHVGVRSERKKGRGDAQSATGIIDRNGRVRGAQRGAGGVLDAQRAAEDHHCMENNNE